MQRSKYGVMGMLERIREPKAGVAPSRRGVAPVLLFVSDAPGCLAGVSSTSLRN